MYQNSHRGFQRVKTGFSDMRQMIRSGTGKSDERKIPKLMRNRPATGKFPAFFFLGKCYPVFSDFSPWSPVL
jgi:hypothetical protein